MSSHLSGPAISVVLKVPSRVHLGASVEDVVSCKISFPERWKQVKIMSVSGRVIRRADSEHKAKIGFRTSTCLELFAARLEAIEGSGAVLLLASPGRMCGGSLISSGRRIYRAANNRTDRASQQHD